MKGGQIFLDTYMITLDKNLLYGIVIQLIILGILFFALRAILYKPIVEFLEKRKERIKNDITDASNKLATAEMLKAEYEIKLKEIEKERTSILEEARNIAKQTEENIINDAKKEAEIIRNRANLDIEREKEKVKEDIREQIIEVSSLVASKFIKKSISKEEHSFLIDKVITDLEEVRWEN